MRVIISRCVVAIFALVAFGVAPSFAEEEKPWRGLKNAYLSVVLNSTADLTSNIKKLVNAVAKDDAGTELLQEIEENLGLKEAFDENHIVVMELLNERKYPGSFYVALGAAGAEDILKTLAGDMEIELAEDLAVADFAKDNEFELDLGDDELLHIKSHKGWLIISDDLIVTRRAAKAVTLKTPTRHEEYFIRAHLKNSELQDAHGALIKSSMFAGRAMIPMMLAQLPEEGKDIYGRLYEVVFDIVEDMLECFSSCDVYLKFDDRAIDLNIAVAPSEDSLLMSWFGMFRPIDFSQEYLPGKNNFINTIVNSSREESAAIFEVVALKAAYVYKGGDAGKYRCEAHAEQLSNTKDKCELCGAELVMGETAQKLYTLFVDIIGGQIVQAMEVTPKGLLLTNQFYDNKNIEAIRKLMTSSIIKELLNSELMPMEVKYVIDKDEGPFGPIDGIEYADKTADGEGNAMLAMQQEMAKAMGTYEPAIIAPLYDGVIMMQGKDSALRYNKLVKEIQEKNALDNEKVYEGFAWEGASSELKTLVEKIETPPVMIMEINFGQYLHLIVKMMAVMFGEMDTEKYRKMEEMTAATMHISDDKKLIANVNIPIKPITAFADFFKEMVEMQGGRGGDDIDEPMDEFDGEDADEEIW